MEILRTDKEKTYRIDFVAKSFNGNVTLAMSDNRLVSEIAPEFEGIEHMEYEDEDTGETGEFNGYSVLVSIIRTDFHDKLQISMKRPNDE